MSSFDENFQKALEATKRISKELPGAVAGIKGGKATNPSWTSTDGAYSIKTVPSRLHKGYDGVIFGAGAGEIGSSNGWSTPAEALSKALFDLNRTHPELFAARNQTTMNCRVCKQQIYLARGGSTGLYGYCSKCEATTEVPAAGESAPTKAKRQKKVSELDAAALEGFNAETSASLPYLKTSPSAYAWLIGRHLKTSGRTAPRDVRMGRGYTIWANDMLFNADTLERLK